MKVDVVIPTMGRPAQLERAVRSLFAPANAQMIDTLVIVDNHPDGSAEPTFLKLAAEAAFRISYVHEPRAGVANARNAGVSACRDATFLAFLDDDETASDQWLSSLVSTALDLQADVVFGPIDGVASEAPPAIRPVVEDFFSRCGPEGSGIAPIPYGCGNSLIRMGVLIQPQPFDIATNETGGEDDALFAKLQNDGAVFGWSAEAKVKEHVPPHRSTYRYLMTRAFARGQGPSQTAAARCRWLELLRWNVVGIVQTVLFSGAALFTRPFSEVRSTKCCIRAAEGLGKIFWFKGFEPKLYGSRELGRTSLESGHQAT